MWEKIFYAKWNRKNAGRIILRVSDDRARLKQSDCKRDKERHYINNKKINPKGKADINRQKGETDSNK